MEERIRVITYKGIELVYSDHRGLRDDDLLNNTINSFKIIKEKGIGLTLDDFTDTFVTDKLMTYLKSDEAVQITNNVIKKSACVGISGIKKLLLNAYNKLTNGRTKVFDTEEEAKEWLIQE